MFRRGHDNSGGGSGGGSGSGADHSPYAQGVAGGEHSKKSLKDWRRRFGEKTMTKLGLREQVADEVAQPIEEPLASLGACTQRIDAMREEAHNYAKSVQTHLAAISSLGFLAGGSATVSAGGGEDGSLDLFNRMTQQDVHEVVRRALMEKVEGPLTAARRHVNQTEALVAQRANFLLDYQHHKRKYEATEERLGRAQDSRRMELEEELQTRKMKLFNATEELLDTTNNLLAHIAALEDVLPRLRRSTSNAIYAVERTFCRNMDTALSESIQSADADGIALMLGLEADTQQVREGHTLPVVNVPEELDEFVTSLNLACGTGGLVFGRAISAFGDDIPAILYQAIHFIDKHGLYREGLFRVPGNEDMIAEIRRQVDTGAFDSFDAETALHDVGSLLKLFFRLLPEPAIPRQCYTALLQAVGKPDSAELIHAVLYNDAILDIERNALRLLFGLLVRVSQCSAYNKMSPDNIAIVFAPTLLRPPGSDEIAIADLQGCINLVRLMVERAEDVFPDLWNGYPASTLDESEVVPQGSRAAAKSDADAHAERQARRAESPAKQALAAVTTTTAGRVSPSLEPALEGPPPPVPGAPSARKFSRADPRNVLTPRTAAAMAAAAGDDDEGAAANGPSSMHSKGAEAETDGYAAACDAEVAVATGAGASEDEGAGTAESAGGDDVDADGDGSGDDG